MHATVHAVPNRLQDALQLTQPIYACMYARTPALYRLSASQCPFELPHTLAQLELHTDMYMHQRPVPVLVSLPITSDTMPTWLVTQRRGACMLLCKSKHKER